MSKKVKIKEKKPRIKEIEHTQNSGLENDVKSQKTNSGFFSINFANKSQKTNPTIENTERIIPRTQTITAQTSEETDTSLRTVTYRETTQERSSYSTAIRQESPAEGTVPIHDLSPRLNPNLRLQELQDATFLDLDNRAHLERNDLQNQERQRAYEEQRKKKPEGY